MVVWWFGGFSAFLALLVSNLDTFIKFLKPCSISILLYIYLCTVILTVVYMYINMIVKIILTAHENSKLFIKSILEEKNKNPNYVFDSEIYLSSYLSYLFCVFKFTSSKLIKFSQYLNDRYKDESGNVRIAFYLYQIQNILIFIVIILICSFLAILISNLKFI